MTITLDDLRIVAEGRAMGGCGCDDCGDAAPRFERYGSEFEVWKCGHGENGAGEFVLYENGIWRFAVMSDVLDALAPILVSE